MFVEFLKKIKEIVCRFEKRKNKQINASYYPGIRGLHSMIFFADYTRQPFKLSWEKHTFSKVPIQVQ